MRYYFINQDMKEMCFDVDQTHKNPKISFQVSCDGNVCHLYVRTLAGKNYFSIDGKKWKKLPKLGLNEVLVSNTEIFKVYRGYKPSGLFSGGAGALVTQMPGKIVKILVKEGEKVVKGQTLIILEAMKMENEIKAGLDGTIKNIAVQEGQALENGVLMMDIEEI